MGPRDEPTLVTTLVFSSLPQPCQIRVRAKVDSLRHQARSSSAKGSTKFVCTSSIWCRTCHICAYLRAILEDLLQICTTCSGPPGSGRRVLGPRPRRNHCIVGNRDHIWLCRKHFKHRHVVQKMWVFSPCTGNGFGNGLSCVSPTRCGSIPSCHGAWVLFWSTNLECSACQSIQSRVFSVRVQNGSAMFS